MKKNRFFFLAGLVFLGVTSCLSIKSIDSDKPVQIGRFAFGINEDKDYLKPIFYDKFGNDPAKLAPVLSALMEEYYYLYVQAVAKEGIKLDVERFKNEFLNPESPPNFKITALGPGQLYEFTVDPQDSIYASCQMTFDLDLTPGSRTNGAVIFNLKSDNMFLPSNANFTFVRGNIISKTIWVK